VRLSLLYPDDRSLTGQKNPDISQFVYSSSKKSSAQQCDDNRHLSSKIGIPHPRRMWI